MPSQFISIEGIEGAGKSTAIELIANMLKKQHINFVTTREPGGTVLAETLRNLILMDDDKEKLTDQSELLLMFAARSQHIQHIIAPALATGKWIICDRYIDASYAYQGAGRGLNIEQIRTLDQWIVANYYPNLTLLLDLPPTLGMIRAAQRSGHIDRIESQQISFFERVREGYLQRAAEGPRRIKIINAALTLPEVTEQITHVLNQFLQQQTL